MNDALGSKVLDPSWLLRRLSAETPQRYGDLEKRLLSTVRTHRREKRTPREYTLLTPLPTIRRQAGKGVNLRQPEAETLR